MIFPNIFPSGHLWLHKTINFSTFIRSFTWITLSQCQTNVVCMDVVRVDIIGEQVHAESLHIRFVRDRRRGEQEN